jgi:hypothetical protein
MEMNDRGFTIDVDANWGQTPAGHAAYWRSLAAPESPEFPEFEKFAQDPEDELAYYRSMAIQEEEEWIHRNIRVDLPDWESDSEASQGADSVSGSVKKEMDDFAARLIEKVQ